MEEVQRLSGEILLNRSCVVTATNCSLAEESNAGPDLWFLLITVGRFCLWQEGARNPGVMRWLHF